jgi:hypothetical protein
MRLNDLISKIRTEALLTEQQKSDIEIVRSGKEFISNYLEPLISESVKNKDLNPEIFEVDTSNNWITIYFKLNFIRFFLDYDYEITVNHRMTLMDRLQIIDNKLFSVKFQRPLSEEVIELYLDRLFMELEEHDIL